MTYLFEYTILDDNIKVEYTFSAVTDGIKVVDMWVDDKPHVEDNYHYAECTTYK